MKQMRFFVIENRPKAREFEIKFKGAVAMERGDWVLRNLDRNRLKEGCHYVVTGIDGNHFDSITETWKPGERARHVIWLWTKRVGRRVLAPKVRP